MLSSIESGDIKSKYSKYFEEHSFENNFLTCNCLSLITSRIAQVCPEALGEVIAFTRKRIHPEELGQLYVFDFLTFFEQQKKSPNWQVLETEDIKIGDFIFYKNIRDKKHVMIIDNVIRPHIFEVIHSSPYHNGKFTKKGVQKSMVVFDPDFKGVFRDDKKKKERIVQLYAARLKKAPVPCPN